MKKQSPKTSMGSRRRVEVSACLWMDMLGYGEMLRNVKFDITKPEAQTVIDRLFQFQDVIAKHSMKLFRTVVLNDGCVSHRELSPRSKSVTHDFLNRAYLLHTEVNELERRNKFPGIRSVVAVGFRHRRKTVNHSLLIDEVGSRLIQSAESGQISTKEAIIKALCTRASFDLIPELQANFAFSKAYIADSKGSKGGFGGPHFFVDTNMLPKTLPNWIEYDEKPLLNEEGIGGHFYRISKMKTFPLNSDNKELLDAFEIAEQITGSSSVTSRLQDMTIAGGIHKFA